MEDAENQLTKAIGTLKSAELTRLEMAIEVRCPGKLGWAQVAQFGLRECRDIAPMRAHLGERICPGHRRRSRGGRRRGVESSLIDVKPPKI